MAAPPLSDLFYRLREAGLSLGVDDYRALLDALGAGFGLPDRVALARLCTALWVKSSEDRAAFDYHFARALESKPLGDAVPPTARETPTPPAPTADGPSLVLPVAPPPEPAAGAGRGESLQALAALPAAATEEETRLGRYLHAAEHDPITRRQMKQGWRRLRRTMRQGPPTELDAEATARRAAADGFLLEPVLRPPRVNRAELVLLLDRGGSMVPFHDLARTLARTAVRDGRLGSADVYYFHNCPAEHLYRDAALADARPLAEMLAGVPRAHASVLIFSDAGAARGGFSGPRAAHTRTFLARMRGHFRRLAWLNPMPAARWRGTTAGAVARVVPMFPLDRAGWQAAVGALRGRRGRAS